MTDTVYTHLDTPIGALLLAGDGERLSLVGFPDGPRAEVPKIGWRQHDPSFVEAKRQLTAYFAGALTRFDLPLALNGTPFQVRVWQALTTLPYGETSTYGEMAARLGTPKASRAVGAANGANPLPIIVPCHRLIGANGSLVKFGGGLDRKRFLLAHEERVLTTA